MKHLMASILVLLFATSGLQVAKAQHSCLRDEVVFSFASVIAVQGDVNTWVQGYSSCPANIVAGVQALVAAYNSMAQTPVPTATVSESSPNSQAVCGDWRVIPTHVFTRSLGDGFKQLHVGLAVVNNSPYWGMFNFNTSDLFVTTEGGFRYDFYGGEIPTNSPYAQEYYPEYAGGLYTARRIEPHVPIPPGFAIRGVAGDISGGFQADFRVAESQNQYTLTIPSLMVICFSPEIPRGYYSYEPIIWNLSNDVQPVTFPTSLPDADLGNTTEPIEVPNVGTFEFIDVQRQADTNAVVIRFLFTNPSAGYEAYGEIADAYLIGSNGASYRIYLPESQISCLAAPSQSCEVSAAFPMASGVSNLKLVLLFSDPWVITPEVFNLPDAA